MHYNVIKTAAGARTRLRLPMVWKADAVAAEELPEAVFWVFIGGERVRVEKTQHSEDEYIFPALQAGQYAWDLVVDAQVVLHGVLKVRGSAVPPGGGEVCGTLLVDAPAMVLVLSPGPRGEVGPVGPQGLSAYEVALQHGYEGSEDDWAEELSGAQAAATAAKEQATEAGKQASAAADSAKAAADSATTAGEQATAAEGSAKAAASSADAAGKQASAAADSAKAAADSATTAGEQATAAEGSAKAAASSATTAGAQASAAEGSAKAAAGSATTAGKQASAAADSAKAADSSATTAGEQATAAANSAKAADSSATTASEQATAAANSATAAATAADAVKYDLLPMSVDWLHTQFVHEIGDGNFTVRLNEEQKTLNVSFAHDIPEEQCESLLQLCRRVTPQIVGVVREAVPTDYTELEYLEANGTQYIILPEVFNINKENTPNSGIKLRSLDYADAAANYAFRINVSTSNAGVPTTWYYIGIRSKSSGSILVGLNGLAGVSNPYEDGKIYNAEINYLNSGIFELNEKTAINATAWVTQINGESTNLLKGATCKLVDVKFSSGTEITRNLVPVLDDKDVPCMYDTVSHTCFRNQGTGTFGYRIKGAAEGVKPFSLRDPYYVAPSGVYARRSGENALEIVADTENPDGEGWEWFANTAGAYENFGIVPQEEFSTE